MEDLTVWSLQWHLHTELPGPVTHSATLSAGWVLTEDGGRWMSRGLPLLSTTVPLRRKKALSVHKSHLVPGSSGRQQQTVAPRRSRAQEEPPGDHVAAAAPALTATQHKKYGTKLAPVMFFDVLYAADLQTRGQLSHTRGVAAQAQLKCQSL